LDGGGGGDTSGIAVGLCCTVLLSKLAFGAAQYK